MSFGLLVDIGEVAGCLHVSAYSPITSVDLFCGAGICVGGHLACSPHAIPLSIADFPVHVTTLKQCFISYLSFLTTISWTTFDGLRYRSQWEPVLAYVGLQGFGEVAVSIFCRVAQEAWEQLLPFAKDRSLACRGAWPAWHLQSHLTQIQNKTQFDMFPRSPHTCCKTLMACDADLW